MQKHPELSILIVSYNTRDMTLECLQSIWDATRETSFEVILIDNNSSDGSADAVETQFPDVRLVRSDKNLGFAGANNIAAEHARGAFLLLLNPDTVVQDGAIDALMAFARSEVEAGIWGGRTLFADGSLNPASCWREMSLWNIFCCTTGLRAIFPQSELFNGEAYGGWKRDTVRRVDIVSGCFLLIDRHLWQRLEGFDEAFFMYGEEADLCLRARSLGARPVITPDATIVHYGGASETVRHHKMSRLLQAKVGLIQRHWSEPKRTTGIQLLALWPWTRWLVYACLSMISRSNNYAELERTWAAICCDRRDWIKGVLKTRCVGAH